MSKTLPEASRPPAEEKGSVMGQVSIDHSHVRTRMVRYRAMCLLMLDAGTVEDCCGRVGDYADVFLGSCWVSGRLVRKDGAWLLSGLLGSL